MPEKYQALYRKWRPMTFDDVVGQEHITKTLKNELASGRLGHAYLFCGTRGTGKTSTAKIFSRAVNCENPQGGEPCNTCETCRGIIDGRIMDVYEMDAASNNGVDAVRSLREEVIYTPAGCKYKVYIIDEVHMLTIQAFNALLKTLEEPPEHALFILATTEPQKIPQTILSRCQRYDFKRIGSDQIARRLKKVAREEGIEATEDALELIAELGDGSMRDALSILDRCSAFGGELRRADVSEIVGIVDERALFEIGSAAFGGETSRAVAALDSLLNAGKNPLTFFEDFIDFLRALLLCKECENPGDILEKSPEAVEKLKETAEPITASRLIYGINILSEYHSRAKAMSSPKIAAEIGLIKLCKPEYSSEKEALVARIEKLEQQIKTGVAVSPPKAAMEKPKAERVEEAPPWDEPPEQPEVPQKPKSAAAESGSWSLWPEVLDAIKQSSKTLFMYLYKAEVTREGDNVNVRVKNKIAYEKTATVKGLEYLSELFSKMSGESLHAKITMDDGTSSAENTGPSIMDIVNKKQMYGDIIKIKGE